MCDQTRLVQVLTNLCANGIQYIPTLLPFFSTPQGQVSQHHLCRYTPGGSVELKVEAVDLPPLCSSHSEREVEQPSSVAVRFSVSDNGKGMSPAEVPHECART